MPEGSTTTAWLAELDVQFASAVLHFALCRAHRRAVPRQLGALFLRRGQTEISRIQFALAGMNAHINHDLPLAIVANCKAQEFRLPRHGHRSTTITRRSMRVGQASSTWPEESQRFVFLATRFLPSRTSKISSLPGTSRTSAKEHGGMQRVSGRIPRLPRPVFEGTIEKIHGISPCEALLVPVS